MGGGTYARFTPGASGAGGKNAEYVTREGAVLDGTDGVLVHNLPPDVAEGVAGARTYAEARDHLTAYARTQEALEVRRHGGRAGEPRTHYRAVLSFERDVTTGQARRMTAEWLGDRFGAARAFAVVHRNTDHTHVHVWVDARGVDGKKLHFSRSAYRGLDAAWNRVYSREMGRDEREHLDKKAETRAYRRARAEGRPAERPARSVKRGPGRSRRPDADRQGRDRPADAAAVRPGERLREVEARIEALAERRGEAERAVAREGHAVRQLRAGLGRVYRDPGAAAARLEAAERADGVGPALGALRERPQAYGALRGRGLGPVGDAERRGALRAVRDLGGFLAGYAEARRAGGAARAGLAGLDREGVKLQVTYERLAREFSNVGWAGSSMSPEEEAKWEEQAHREHVEWVEREETEALGRESAERQRASDEARPSQGWER